MGTSGRGRARVLYPVAGAAVLAGVLILLGFCAGPIFPPEDVDRDSAGGGPVDEPEGPDAEASHVVGWHCE